MWKLFETFEDPLIYLNTMQIVIKISKKKINNIHIMYYFRFLIYDVVDLFDNRLNTKRHDKLNHA